MDQLLRGRLLSFNDQPRDDDPQSYTYLEDGGLLIRAGRIAALDDFALLRDRVPDAPVIDHGPHLILPGFIDPHIHFPQTQVIASYGTQLLDWLNTYTFPEERRYADADFAKTMASRFFDALLRHGTTTAVAFCSVHSTSADAFFAEALARGLRMVGGKVLMDRNAPEGLLDTAQSGYDDTKALIARWHGRGRLHYAISPRFAITSTEAQMEAAGALAKEHPDLHIQTHLAENLDECAFACSLFPFAPDYTGIYEHYGLLGPRSLMGHCIHLSEREKQALAETGSVAVFNPTSNLFLGSGLFDLAGLECARVRTAIATDIGGGTSYSLLGTLDAAYKILQLQGQKLAPLAAFYRATLGNARALGLEKYIGHLGEGADADLVVLDARATPAMRLRAERLKTLPEELFLLQTLGDDRAVVETYVAGRPTRTGA